MRDGQGERGGDRERERERETQKEREGEERVRERGRENERESGSFYAERKWKLSSLGARAVAGWSHLLHLVWRRINPNSRFRVNVVRLCLFHAEDIHPRLLFQDHPGVHVESDLDPFDRPWICTPSSLPHTYSHRSNVQKTTAGTKLQWDT